MFYCFVIINCDQKKSKFPKNSNLKINALIHFIWITSTGDEIDGYLYYLGGTLGTLTLGSLAASVAYYFATRPVPERPLVPLENQSPLLEVCWFRNWSTLISSITSFNIQLRTVCLEFSLRLGCVWGRTGESPEACGPKRAALMCTSPRSRVGFPKTDSASLLSSHDFHTFSPFRYSFRLCSSTFSRDVCATVVRKWLKIAATTSCSNVWISFAKTATFSLINYRMTAARQ